MSGGLRGKYLFVSKPGGAVMVRKGKKQEEGSYSLFSCSRCINLPSVGHGA